jgi:hypothetical protein
MKQGSICRRFIVASALLFSAAWLFAIAPVRQAVAQNTQSVQKSPEEQAWLSIQPFDIPGLQTFVAKFPDSKFKQSADDTIALLTKFESIRSGKVKPACEIKFDSLGKYDDGEPAWTYFKRASPARGAAGFFRSGNTAGIFMPVARWDSISFGNNGQPRWPAGDGSVWGIDSGDAVLWFIPGLKFQTHGKLFLGVIADRGLVCLSGSGSLIFVGGPTISVP